MVLLHTEPSTLTVAHYTVIPQQQQDNGPAASSRWSVQASYQTKGSLLSKQDAVTFFHSDQLMVSSDGTQVVLLTHSSGVLKMGMADLVHTRQNRFCCV